MKKCIKESFGVIVLVLILIILLIGIYLLSEFIIIYGFIFFVCLIFGMYRYV